MTSQKLWVQHNTTEKTFIDLVPTEGCTYIAEFLNEIKKESQLAIPQDSVITLYKPDGTTEIKPTDTINSLGSSGKDGDAPLIVKTLSLALTTGSIMSKSPFPGQVLSVYINQSKLMKKYLTPVGSSPTNPVETTPTPIDISSLGLQLEQLMFYENTTARPCIVVDVDPISDDFIEQPPYITIVLITGFAGCPLHEVMVQEEFKRVMPIRPTPSLPGTATRINTVPEWMPHPKRKVPSYILCIPIKVYGQNLRRLQDAVQLDEQNLQMLKLHILSLGGIRANADFVDLEDDSDSDDEVEVRCEDLNRIVTWDEIVV